MGHHEHEKLAQKKLSVAIMTFSDTRDESSDKSGKILIEGIKQAGHKVILYSVMKENPEEMKAALQEWLENKELDVIITNGGTGLTARDGTVEVARELFDKELDGFGEIFRLISYQQIGAAAILSRATAGAASGKILACLPGSSKAVKLALDRILIPQLPHMVWEANR